MKKRLLLILSLLIFMMLLIGCNSKNTNDNFEVSVKEFNKHGNVILDVTFDQLKEKNIEVMDIINVKIDEEMLSIPVGTSFSDVDSGSMICRFDIEDAKVILAVNGGNFAETAKMAIKEKITEEPGYKWNVSIDKVIISLKEKNGYKDEYTIRHLIRTSERSDYSALSDAEYANCRAVSVTGIKENMLFRGTTPLDDSMNRNTFAMNFLNDKKINAIINLTDSYQEMISYSTYESSYYANCIVANIVADYEFTKTSFGSKVKECVEFINNNDGPYYIHCKEGKDRTGVLCAILECYLNATIDEVMNDYMLTYENFYHVERNSETYNIILRTNIQKTLCGIFNVDSLNNVNLHDAAEKYLLSTGLTQNDLTNLIAKLGK